MFKIAIAITGSIAINFSIWAALTTEPKTIWHLGQSDLKAETVQSLMQALQLTETKTKIVSANKPVAEVLKTANVAAEKEPQKVIVAKAKDTPEVQKIKTESKVKKAKEELKEEVKEAAKEIAKQNTKKQQAVAKITQAPKLAYTPPQLSYPISAIKNNEEGKVKVKAVINAKGQVASVEIIHSSGFSVLDQAAIAWFRKLQFKPAQSGKTPIAATVKQIISFNLQEQKNA